MGAPLAAVCREATSQCPHELNARGTAADGRRGGRGSTDVMLVVSSVAIALGLGAVAASLAPAPGDEGEIAWQQPPMVVTRDNAPRPGASYDHPAGSPATPGQRASRPAFGAYPTVSATRPWKSPLYPQNGVTLWDRIRVSSKRDPWAFLLGTTIQIHAPETAATPGPRDMLRPCCPRS